MVRVRVKVSATVGVRVRVSVRVRVRVRVSVIMSFVQMSHVKADDSVEIEVQRVRCVRSADAFLGLPLTLAVALGLPVTLALSSNVIKQDRIIHQTSLDIKLIIQV